MKKILQPLFLLLVLLVPMAAMADSANTLCKVTRGSLLGDVNGDGQISISDVTAMIYFLLDEGSSLSNEAIADLNQNGVVTIADATMLINFLLSGETEAPSLFETFTINGVSFTMVYVAPGTFMMGPPDDDPYAISTERPAHQVTLTKGFSISTTEVTQALWLAVMGENPSYFSSDNGFEENLNRPVEYISWWDCQEFVTRLSGYTGRPFRLPTEAQWEFAARGGNKTHGYRYSGSSSVDDVCWCYETMALGSSTFSHGPQPVGLKMPNELGLYDMSGNVWELVQDKFAFYSAEPQVDPIGPTSSMISQTLVRSGDWNSAQTGCSVYHRVSVMMREAQSNTGFRIAL